MGFVVGRIFPRRLAGGAGPGSRRLVGGFLGVVVAGTSRRRAAAALAEGVGAGGQQADQQGAAEDPERFSRRAFAQRAEAGGGVGTTGGKPVAGMVGQAAGTVGQGVAGRVLDQMADVLGEQGDVFADAGEEAGGPAVGEWGVHGSDGGNPPISTRIRSSGSGPFFRRGGGAARANAKRARPRRAPVLKSPPGQRKGVQPWLAPAAAAASSALAVWDGLLVSQRPSWRFGPGRP